MKKTSFHNIFKGLFYRIRFVFLSVYLFFITTQILAECSPTSETQGATASYTGVLGTDIVTVTVTPPTDPDCVVYGLCITSNANGFKVDNSCGGPYSANFMWGFFRTDPTKKIAFLNTTSSANQCPNLPINQPTLTLTIPSTSPYEWSYDPKGLVYVALAPSDTLVFTISETDSGSTTQVNNYFTHCSDTTLKTCSNLNWNFYNDPGIGAVTPSLTQIDTMLTGFHPQDSAYQWYFNGEPIPGADSAILILSQSGLYHVEVTLASGCHVSSPEFTYIAASVKELPLHTNTCRIWPNPADNRLNISLDLKQPAPISITIFDLSGRIMLSGKFNHHSGYLKEGIDISQLKTGLYFLRIEAGSESILKKIIKVSEP